MPKVKDLLVLSECVDGRSGTRFKKGDFFDPTPTGDQAVRLVRAGCLPQGAIKLGEAEDARLAKKAEEDAKLADKVEQRNAAIAAAVNADATAKLALEEAEAELAAAGTDSAKAEAAEKVTAAKAAADKASDELAKAQK
jgi:hypothetical protein